MHLKTEHLHSRQIFRSPRCALGRKWRSPSTGNELVIVGGDGDADDPGRERALYAHEYYEGGPAMLLYPELAQSFTRGKFLLARRVSEDGWCRPGNDVICVPFEGMRGVYGVDLVGYGPTEWLPDGITGQECLERPIKEWRALAIWRDPDRMVAVASLQRGWVIRSEQFARAVPQYSFKPEGELRLYQDREDDACDTERGKALHVVEELDPREDIEWDDGPEDYSSLRVRVRRLAHDGTYDPRGQIIEFQQARHRPDRKPHSPFHPVEIVGQMAFDGSGVSYTLPKPLTL